MAIRRVVTEEDDGIEPKVVKTTTKRIVNSDIHTPVVEQSNVTVDSDSGPTIKQTSVVHEPLVKTEHPQRIFEKKRTIFRSYQIIWYVLAILEILLGFRITLKAIGADPFSGFVSFIYALSAPFSVPFFGIVNPTVAGNGIIEWSTMFAAVVYFLIAWGLVSLINLLKPVTPEEVEENV